MRKVSGRNREFLEQHFGAYKSLTLIAEHGHFLRLQNMDPRFQHSTFCCRFFFHWFTLGFCPIATASQGYFKMGPDTDGEWVSFSPYPSLEWKARQTGEGRHPTTCCKPAGALGEDSACSPYVHALYSRPGRFPHLCVCFIARHLQGFIRQGAHTEEKASAIVWHYRDCDEKFGEFKAKELMHQQLGVET